MNRSHSPLLVWPAGILLALALLGCGGSSGSKSVTSPPGRGDVVSSTLARTVTAADMADMLKGAGITGVSASYAVRFYRVVYSTVDVAGRATTASGMVAIPQGTGAAMPLLSYQHGTAYAKADAPSNPENAEFLGVAAVACSSGSVAVGADYLGLGVSTGLHPYLHADSEASACLDMLRAARALCRSLGVTLNSQLFLAGYSQGGHSTMALHRLIEAQYRAEFQVTAAAPCAGPYDLAGATLTGALNDPSPRTPGYLAYLLLSYQMVYGILPSLGTVLQSPYAALANQVISGSLTAEEAIAQIPTSATAATLLQPAFILSVAANPSQPILQRLRENSVYDWRPAAPVRLYHGTADKDVPYQNSVVAEAAMKAGGADVLLVPLSGDHLAAAAPALLQAAAWFSSLRQ